MLGIEDFLLAAESVLGVDPDRLQRVTKIALAESALAAPHAGFAGHVFYPEPVQQAAILASRIMHNHPLPDGNKRVALVLMDVHLQEHGLEFSAAPEEIDRVFRCVASHRTSEEEFVTWLRERVAIWKPT